MLMRPEYRNEIDAKYKKKIEQIVRWVLSATLVPKLTVSDVVSLRRGRSPRRTRHALTATHQSPKPTYRFSTSVNILLVIMLISLQCSTCDNILPYCIVTGFHMVRNDWTNCPHCKFPATRTVSTPYVHASMLMSL